jgi:hypothetical protein
VSDRSAECKRLGRMVDRFSAEMKAKLRRKAREGFGGWDDSPNFPNELLENGLNQHRLKRNWIDAANFAAMLWHREQELIKLGERIAKGG